MQDHVMALVKVTLLKNYIILKVFCSVYIYRSLNNYLTIFCSANSTQIVINTYVNHIIV